MISIRPACKEHAQVTPPDPAERVVPPMFGAASGGSCAFIFLAFLAALPIWAGDVRVDVRFAPAAPSLSDTIRMEVTVTGAETSDLILSPVDITPDCVAIQAVAGLGTHQILTLDPLRPGPCTIPAFRTRCVRGRTDGCDVRSAETVIPIGTLVGNPDHPEIRDQDETPVELPDSAEHSVPTPLLRWQLWPALASLAGAYMVFRFWRRRRAEPARVAERHLRRLATMKGDPTEGFSQLSAILRAYLDEKLTLGACRCSSPEILGELNRRSVVPGWRAEAFREFLATCDRARFGGGPVATSEFERAIEDCRTLVQVLDFDIARRTRAGI